MACITYVSVVISMIYAMVCTRSNISHAISVVRKYIWLILIKSIGKL